MALLLVRGARPLSALTVRTPAVRGCLAQSARPLSFLNKFKEQVNEQLDKNPELKKTMEELKNNETLGKAAKAAEQAKENMAKTAETAREQMKDSGSTTGERSEQVADKMRDMLGNAQSTFSSAKETLAKAKEEATAKAAEAKAKLDESAEFQATMKAAEEARAAAAKASAEAAEAAAKLAQEAHEKSGAKEFAESPMMHKINEGIQDFKDEWSGKKQYELRRQKQAEAAAAAQVREEDQDTSTMAVTITEHKETWREKVYNTAESIPVIGALFGAAGRAVEGLGEKSSDVADRVFGETEQAEALRELKERDPSFELEDFMMFLHRDMIPKVIGAYLKGDTATLRETTREQAYASLFATIRERQANGWYWDPKLIHHEPPTLERIALMGMDPTPVVSFQTQQIHCVRDGAGKVVEGSPEEIRAVYYMFALQYSEEEGDGKTPDERWQVTEIAIQGAHVYL